MPLVRRRQTHHSHSQTARPVPRLERSDPQTQQLTQPNLDGAAAKTVSRQSSAFNPTRYYKNYPFF